ncbi:hypothetical protein EV141_1794 [Microcella putealis]|uniref:TspO/MBR related protein n=1 Tax=Microcella putealis TaxID=337005 RepID=A0A4Q7LNP7_9MICO|nr:hypothetical protein [Microcella putealis]RZS56336.1 hypothetical protein EV141_1794 [Microcella putealis]TQM27178.1 hypothetical protein BJ957_0607 [Microcella putealis]
MASDTRPTTNVPATTSSDPVLKRRRAARILVVILAVGQPVSSGLFPLLSDEMMQSGARFSPLIPPGPWFAIWGLIIVASLVWALAQVRPSTIHRERGIRDRLVLPFSIAFASFALWLATAAFGQDNPLGLVVFVAYLVAFVIAWRQVVGARDEIHRWNVTERGLLYLTLGVYSGWTSMAFFVQIATVVQSTGAPYDTAWGITWQTFVLAAATGLAVFFAVVSRGSIAYAATVTYALVGVGISTADAGLTILSIVAAAGVSVVWASTGVVRALAMRRRRDSAAPGDSADARPATTRTRS